MTETIPGGSERGTALADASEQAIRFWLKKKRQENGADPLGWFFTKNEAWIREAEVELAYRNGGVSPESAEQVSDDAMESIQRPPAPASIQALGGASGDAAAVTAKLVELAANFHMVSPATTIDVLPEGCGVALSYVTVDANSGKDGPGDVYDLGGGKVGLSAVTLTRIAVSAGVSWDADLSGRLDKGMDMYYCHYRAVGHVRNFDGSTRTLTGEVEIDAREGSPQIEDIRAKAAAREADPTHRGRKDGGAAQILELRRFILRHAERKAKSRAIADLGIKRSYTRAELKKPFAVTRLTFTGHTEDPELKRAFALKMADAFLGASHAMYGAPRVPAPVPLPAPVHEVALLGECDEGG